MSDLKEFLEKDMEIDFSFKKGFCKRTGRVNNYQIDKEIRRINIESLGLFFWERGGKQFVQRMLDGRYTIDEIIDYFRNDGRIILSGHNCSFTATNYDVEQQNAKDCLACLGEDKFKELIKELKGCEER